MNCFTISHIINENLCEIKIPITKKVQCPTSCDVFVDEHNLIFVADAYIRRFKCEQRFDLMDMKSIPISFNTQRWEYTCVLPCYPVETNTNLPNIEKELDNKNPRNEEHEELSLCKLVRITESCVLSVDGTPCAIQPNYRYGFSGRYKGRPKYDENDLSHICRITNPSLLSCVGRSIQREKDENKDFSQDQYKLNFVELQIPEGHDNPMNHTISFEDTKLTTAEECLLHNITTKNAPAVIDDDRVDIDCGLVSILMAICYDIRLTSDDLTCESPWTRTILSSALSYFEQFDNLTPTVESFLRRSLIYPLYRNYDLSRLCVEDTVAALHKGKDWIIKQLLVTYNCFLEGEYDRKALNRFFLKHYIWYVSTVLDNDYLQMLSRNVKNVLLGTNKKHLRLGLGEIETELLKEIIEDMHLSATDPSEDEPESSSSSDTEVDDESGSETDDDSDSKSVIEKKI